MNNTRVAKKDKSQNIQVSVRVRPLVAAEQNNRSTNIIEVPNNKELIVHEFPKDKFTKKFKFDNVFGPSSKQIDVYNAVVSPLLEQVLAGYNCTVFAYGQTGTGKTFTMEGTNIDPTLHWQSDSSAGMIPRCLSHLFDELQLLEAQEYTIRVSFLELYNEELLDLLSANDDGSKIRLYEDTSKKGAVIIHGLEELTVSSKSEVYRILQQGLERRQTAATLMNAQSSRSHTVFSITVHMKEFTIDGEEVLKTGKLNLVDLAGSENVGRSGAVDRRAREAGNVNQSLLTLGRVITALVERAPHIPYRESKLTRLLQESLGGRTKTSIIATISPANINHEETLSTLDYARRAKNITNRPEVNQKLSKKEFLKQYTVEIERLRRDLLATRERNGVYLADDNYNQMTALISQQSKEIEEKINHIKALEKTMQDQEKIYNEFHLQNIAQMKELHKAKTILGNTTEVLEATKHRLKIITQERDEQKYLVKKHVNTEQTLLSEAQSLVNVADTATADSQKLHDKINRKTDAERKFEELGKQFKTDVCDSLQGIEKYIYEYGENVKQFCTSLRNDIGTQTVTKYEATNSEMHKSTTDLTEQHLVVNNLREKTDNSYLSYQTWMTNDIKNQVDTIKNKDELLNTISLESIENINELIENEVAMILQQLKSNLLGKLKDTATQMNEMIESVCNDEMTASNSIKKNIEIIKRDIEEVCKTQELTEKRRSFTKMMEDVSVEFNLLSKSEKEHCSMIANTCNNVSDVCNNVNDQVTYMRNNSVKMENELREHIQTHLKRIESDVVTGIDKNEQVANRTVTEGKKLLHELKSNVNAGSNVLKRYKNLVEHTTEELQQKMDLDKNEALLLINDTYKILDNANENYTKAMTDEEIKLTDTSKDISSKLENLITESTENCNRNVEHLRSAVNEINRFFEDEIQHDVPTGTTPARREFHYPREFTATSPHERILQRFREARKLVETSEDDDDTDLGGDLTIKQIANSTAISDVTVISSPLNSTEYITPSMNSELLTNHLMSCNPINLNIENFTSTLDISPVYLQSFVGSESTNSQDSLRSEDKENNSCNSVTYEKTRHTQQSRFRKLK
ncbi:PREDICTED: bipolar kinesin KRP-130-like [Dufourea novaeangliae]|uniref:bipolar kinesin KRP-130-like n=1 Tax=Dufourea novaeangliae TaxID=178035 RepID=UPI00076777CF|nr:PREDICTED: bipolar kinesin KRP-130-like [Dufourea novaeangliae]